ncbi:MAG: hypothetical protein ACTSVK_12415 [Promethearchaeota archaeon]
MSKLESTKTLEYKTSLKCCATTPSINAQKEFVKDYKTVSISFTKEQAIKVAHQLLHHGLYGKDKIHLKAERKSLNVTVTSQ